MTTRLGPHILPIGSVVITNKPTTGAVGAEYLDSVQFLIDVDGDGTYSKDATADLLARTSPEVEAGVRGNKPHNQLAGVGTFKGELNNSAANSEGAAGAYSIGHGSQLTGFDKNVMVKFSVTWKTITRDLFTGWLQEADAEAGLYAGRGVAIEAKDYLMHLREYNRVGLVAIQENVTSDTVYTNMLAPLPVQPTATHFTTGDDVLSYVLDHHDAAEAPTTFSEIDKLTQSGWEKFWVLGDGSLYTQPRSARQVHSVSGFHFNDTMMEIETSNSRSLSFDHFEFTTYPREVGTVPEVIFELRNVVKVYPSETIDFSATYKDPDTKVKLGARDVTTAAEMENGVDYKASSVEDDSTSNNMGSALSFVFDIGVKRTDVSVTNNGNTTAYLHFFRLSGVPIRLYDENVYGLDATDTTGGNRIFRQRLFYQDNLYIGRDFAYETRRRWENPPQVINSITFAANQSEATMRFAMTFQFGERITITETQKGISAQDSFINGAKFELVNKDILFVTLFLEPAFDNDVWILGEAGFSEIGTTTYLGL